MDYVLYALVASSPSLLLLLVKIGTKLNGELDRADFAIGFDLMVAAVVAFVVVFTQRLHDVMVLTSQIDALLKDSSPNLTLLKELSERSTALTAQNWRGADVIFALLGWIFLAVAIVRQYGWEKPLTLCSVPPSERRCSEYDLRWSTGIVLPIIFGECALMVVSWYFSLKAWE